jgi:hypothetical protein
MTPRVTNKKQEGLSVRAPIPHPSQMEYTKTPPQKNGSFFFLFEKSPSTAFFL